MSESKGALDARREIKKFDNVASEYSNIHAASVSASGEGVEYFARYKVDRLLQMGLSRESRVLDYGCGIGNLTVLLDKEFDQVTGYDPSAESIAEATGRGLSADFCTSASELADRHFDVVIMAGVLHHIPPADRDTTLRLVLSKLRPGGRIVIFEHNPYNPLTRRAVDACPFDDDAVLLPPSELRQRLDTAGYQKISQRFVVFFPRLFAWFRPLEPALGFVPLGAQTMTIAWR